MRHLATENCCIGHQIDSGYVLNTVIVAELGLVVLQILGLKVTLRCCRPSWWGTANPADPIKTLEGTVQFYTPLP